MLMMMMMRSCFVRLDIDCLLGGLSLAGWCKGWLAGCDCYFIMYHVFCIECHKTEDESNEQANIWMD